MVRENKRENEAQNMPCGWSMVFSSAKKGKEINIWNESHR